MNSIRVNYNSMKVIEALKWCARKNIRSNYDLLKKLTYLDDENLKNGIHINLSLDFIVVEKIKDKKYYKLKN